jgi:hypothetical protein
MGEVATMFGLAPKLKWRLVHRSETHIG